MTAELRERAEHPTDRALAAMTVDERGCWRLPLALDPKGYPRFKRRAADAARPVSFMASRLIYQKFRGPIPDGLELDHLCRVRWCVNPWHVQPVTHKENVRRGLGPIAENMRAATCKSGHPFSGFRKDGQRDCPVCRREYSRRRVAREREARAHGTA